VETPTKITPQPTPRHSHRVLAMYSGRTVADRCDQVSPVPPPNRLAQTLKMGAAAKAAMPSAAKASAPKPRLPGRKNNGVVVGCILVVRQAAA